MTYPPFSASRSHPSVTRSIEGRVCDALWGQPISGRPLSNPPVRLDPPPFRAVFHSERRRGLAGGPSAQTS